MSADNNVNISFRTFLKPGESSFVIPVQRKFADEPNRKFGFETITLMPEYQNIQAFAYKLDSKTELESIVSNPLQLEVSFGPNYHSKEVGKTWSYLTSQSRLDTILLSINQHFEKTKPTGTYYPSVFFDWIHLNSLDEEETIRDYPIKTAEDAYGEAFNPVKHATWLPGSLTSMKVMNNCVFPTADNPDYLSDVRVRMWVAPNTTVTFSNQHLPQVLGFEEEAIPPKTKRGQIPIVNEHPTEYKMIQLFGEPRVTDLPGADLRGTKMNSYTTNNVILSPEVQLMTEKQNEKNPLKLLADYGPTINQLAKSLNFYLDLEFDSATTRKFKFNFPNNPNISVKLLMPSDVIRQLGFDPTVGEYIDQRSVANSIPISVDTEDLGKKAVALVYDTGMVAVDTSQEKSNMTSHSGNLLMSTLHPKLDGTLRNRIYFKDVVRVHVSNRNPDLKFLLYKFDDKGIKCSLDWPVGAYIFGTLSGKL